MNRGRRLAVSWVGGVLVLIFSRLLGGGRRPTVSIDRGGRLSDFVLAGCRGIDRGVLDDSLSDRLAVIDLGLVCTVSSSDVSSLLGLDVLTSEGASLASLCSCGGLGGVGNGVVDRHVLAGNSVDTKLLVCDHFGLRRSVRVLVVILRPLSALVLLDVYRLLLLTLLVEAGSRVAGKSTRVELVVWDFLDPFV
jgi:hypothetical protein